MLRMTVFIKRGSRRPPFPCRMCVLFANGGNISLMTAFPRIDEKASKLAISAWCLFDWACTAFPSVITTFIFGAYFTRKIAVNEIVGTVQWGHAIALAGLLIALSSPLMGAIADHGEKRKPWLFSMTMLAILAASLLWFAYPSPRHVTFTLACVILGLIGIESGMVFYNALLPDLVPRSYFGRVSGWAWGLGYAGALATLIIALFCFVNHPPAWLDTKTAAHIRICGPLVALWIMIFSMPLFLWTPDRLHEKRPFFQAMRLGLVSLFQTLSSLHLQKNVFLFLTAHMIYVDGLNTMFTFAGIYASGTFGMNVQQVIELGILTNIFAGCGAAVFAWVDDHIGAKPTILISLFALIFITFALFLVKTAYWFWILAILLAIFVGPVQAASRSFMTHIIPPEKVTEMFGLYSFSGKATAFLGPWLFAISTSHFGTQRAGIAIVLIFLILGGGLLTYVKESA